MIATMQCTVIDCPDPLALARFYAAVLGWRVGDEDSDPAWVWLTDPATGQRLAFQGVEEYHPPHWPDPARPQQMHLDFDVPERADVERAKGEVVALGATFLHDSGGEKRGFLVFSDPAGHPFCLCYGQTG
ncbi:glyoxalase [Streptomyces cinnamoneus]|uniref:Glyoxalase n=1 Tax=Streptomyces cinnamoneus TaxID=53446 RepID=A0A2G1XQA6_STRCJ|nr:VOC family protein [Streptomyces cinnamoneus]PHQ53424.1 glyoxalase [Streptomyces cinnamoneus]PPT12728.1 VOC family protein [Streptomyces cinnamoneus]